MLRALFDASPHGRMMSSMVETGKEPIVAGVDAWEKSLGLTSFTLASVHCPDKITATSKVNGSWW